MTGAGPSGALRASLGLIGRRLDVDERLVDARRGYLEHIRGMLDAVEERTLSLRIQNLFTRALKAAVQNSAPYSAMIRQNLGNRIAVL